MARYTFKSLDNDIDALNAQLENWGHTPRLQAGQRYGYSALDLATVEQHARHCCERNLETGSPRECLAAAQSYIITGSMDGPHDPDWRDLAEHLDIDPEQREALEHWIVSDHLAYHLEQAGEMIHPRPVRHDRLGTDHQRPSDQHRQRDRNHR